MSKLLTGGDSMSGEFETKSFVCEINSGKIGIIKDIIRPKDAKSSYMVEFEKITKTLQEDEIEPVSDWEEIIAQWSDSINGAMSIDKEIYDVITAFNKLGLRTKYSCSGHEGGMEKFFIMFHEDVNEELLHEWFKRFTIGSISKTGKLELKQWYRWNNLLIPPKYMINYTLQFNDTDEQNKTQLWNEIVWSLRLVLYEKQKDNNSNFQDILGVWKND